MNAPRAVALLAALSVSLSLLAAGCQSMTTLKALEMEKGNTSVLEKEKAELLSEKATLLQRADEARKREERLAARQQAEEYVSGDPQKALAAIESIYHPPPIQKKDEQDRIQEVVVVEPPVLDKPEQAQLELLRGTALYNLKKNADALVAFQAAVKADPSLRLARRNLGKLHFIEKRYPEALEAWKDELADGYRDGDLLYLVAQARYEIGVSRDDPSEKEAARLAMQSVLVERPRDVEVQRWLANLEYESGRFAEAARSLEAIRREAPLDAEYLELLGKCYYNLRDHARALDFLQLAAQVRAPAPEGMKMLAELYAAEGLRGRAAEWLVRAHRGDPKNAPPEVRFEIGMHFFEANRADEASEWLGAVAERDPQYAEAQAALARLYRELGKPDAAIAAFEIVRKVRPQDGPAHLAAASAYLERKSLKQALEAFARAAALPGTEAEGLAGMAETFYASGNPEAAIRHYQKALAAKPGEARFLTAIRQLDEEMRLRAGEESVAALLKTAEKAGETAAEKTPGKTAER